MWKYPTISKTIILLFALSLLGNICHGQDPQINQMKLSSELKAKQTANTYQYYSITFEASKKLIEITVDQDMPSYIGLYLSL